MLPLAVWIAFALPYGAHWLRELRADTHIMRGLMEMGRGNINRRSRTSAPPKRLNPPHGLPDRR